ncbi:hypothetical protein BRARA_J02867 [Brassica rapa]|uniref:HMA domain-containing protein n=3 Tax=Brassica TaxID=3705 RepID=A0A397XPC0_BRACM|nr:protein SODIUM POTASSIUM ROOT DEFECTIVE 1 [Brassica napus]KAH0908046.1 hypothetical protein HID58_039873 [Brassica napus]RID43029.1 hypothetical protein BRARA_J02867 [Brassica rapa]CAF2362812.1 unnamed protein product [Brassica napus]CAG7912159.1 unnamed protein product [Brassica rapa]
MLCASQASTRNICSTMDQPSQPSSSSPTVRLGGRAIDRHNPIIRDGRRFTPPPSPNHNSSSAPPSSSSTYHTPLKTRLGLESSETTRVSKRKSKKNQFDAGKSPISCFTSDTPQGSSRYLLSNPVFFDGFVDSDPIPVPIEPEITMDEDLDKTHEDRLVINASKHLSSSSFLENKQPDFFDGFLDYDPVMSPNNPFYESTKASPIASQSSHEDKDVSSPDNPLSEHTKASPTASQSSLEDKDVSSPDFKFSPPQPPPPPPPPSPPPMENNSSSDQVVVLRVSLHCKGCAGKVKKHLSKLKGVTSFNIDFAAKKVTVTGDVTPLAVLASISKVKNAQVWPETIQK